MDRTPFKISPEQKESLISMEDDIKFLQDEANKISELGIEVPDLTKDIVKIKKARDGLLKDFCP